MAQEIEKIVSHSSKNVPVKVFLTEQIQRLFVAVKDHKSLKSVWEGQIFREKQKRALPAEYLHGLNARENSFSTSMKNYLFPLVVSRSIKPLFYKAFSTFD